MLIWLNVILAEDQKLNTHVFHWPEHIKNVFEIAQKIIISKRDSIEDELRSRTAKFEEKLNDMMKEVESFKKKEVILNIHMCSIK